MKTVVNKTFRPLQVPLPRGKVLHLGPKKEGQIADGAEEHPSLKRMLDAGEIEILDTGADQAGARGEGPAPHEATHGFGHKVIHKSGDR